MSFKNLVTFLIISFTIISCGSKNKTEDVKEFRTKINKIAEDYVKLILKIGQHEPSYVDAYYGPEEWKPKEEVIVKDSAAIQNLFDESGILLARLDSLGKYEVEEIEVLRFKFLYEQLLAVKVKLFMLAEGEFSFDEEAKLLYDADPPEYDESHFKKVLDELDKLLPGEGSLSERLTEHRKNFIIPKEKLDTVFQAAINECKKRTLQHIKLPPNENFEVRYVTGKSWAGYNWYKGNSFSIIEVNTDFPIYIDRAVDLAAHEGYPGHHVYNLLLEKEMVRERGWMEFSVYPLNSPQSLIAEGTANYGIEVAFPGDSRIKFEKEVLFPLAGLDATNAEEYYRLQDLVDQLSFAGNEAARKYLNHEWTREETKNWLIKYSLATPQKAEARLNFIDEYRSYVINYNVGKQIVKNYIEKNGGTADNPEKRWELFKYIISTPQTASNLE